MLAQIQWFQWFNSHRLASRFMERTAHSPHQSALINPFHLIGYWWLKFPSKPIVVYLRGRINHLGLVIYTYTVYSGQLGTLFAQRAPSPHIVTSRA